MHQPQGAMVNISVPTAGDQLEPNKAQFEFVYGTRSRWKEAGYARCDRDPARQTRNKRLPAAGPSCWCRGIARFVLIRIRHGRPNRFSLSPNDGDTASIDVRAAGWLLSTIEQKQIGFDKITQIS